MFNFQKWDLQRSASLINFVMTDRSIRLQSTHKTGSVVMILPIYGAAFGLVKGLFFIAETNPSLYIELQNIKILPYS